MNNGSYIYLMLSVPGTALVLQQCPRLCPGLETGWGSHRDFNTRRGWGSPGRGEAPGRPPSGKLRPGRARSAYRGRKIHLSPLPAPPALPLCAIPLPLSRGRFSPSSLHRPPTPHPYTPLSHNAGTHFFIENHGAKFTIQVKAGSIQCGEWGEFA